MMPLISSVAVGNFVFLAGAPSSIQSMEPYCVSHRLI